LENLQLLKEYLWTIVKLFQRYYQQIENMELNFPNCFKRQNKILFYLIYILGKQQILHRISAYNQIRNAIILWRIIKICFLSNNNTEELNVVLIYIIAFFKSQPENFHGNKYMIIMTMYIISRINLSINLKVKTKIYFWQIKSLSIGVMYWISGMIIRTKN
jgi:hypothetical protein